MEKTAEREQHSLSNATQKLIQPILTRQTGDSDGAACHAEQGQDRLDLLIHGIVHDINNLVSVQNGWLTMATEKIPADPVVHKCALKAGQISDRLIRLCSRLQNIYRSKKMGFETPVALDLGECIAETIPLLGFLSLRNIIIAADIADKPWHTLIDEVQFDRLFMNLISNCTDAMPRGGKIRIDVKNVVFTSTELGLLSASRAGSFVCIRITDDGRGMPNDMLRTAFAPYATTPAPIGRSGLGLFVVSEILNRYHGWLNAESEPNAGTTVSIYLPACDEIS